MAERRSQNRFRGIAVRVAVFLLLGAVVNVAVAWGFAAFGSYHDGEPERLFFRPHTNEMCWYSVVDERYLGERWIKFIVADSESLANQFCGLWKFDEDPWSEQELPAWTRVDAVSNMVVATQDESCMYADVGFGWPSTSLVYYISLTMRQFKNGAPQTNEWGIAVKTGAGGVTRYLPLVLIWPGFAINTLFYAAIPWLLFAAPGRVRRWRRIRRGLCVKCAYPVGASDVCTECGAQISKTIRWRGSMSLRVANGDWLPPLSRGESPTRPATHASESEITT